MTSSQWSVALETNPDPVIRQDVLVPLVADNEASGGPSRSELLAVTVRDLSGTVVGGLWGRTGYSFLFVELLALGPAKGHGLGRTVMELAEVEARRRGMAGMWVDTFTFQAPGFYLKLGFTECGRITGYPPGHDRIFFVKRFDVLAEESSDA